MPGAETVPKAGRGVSLPHRHQFAARRTDNANTMRTTLIPDVLQSGPMPWTMQMSALSVEEPGRLMQLLTGAILGCGGWVLSRGASDGGAVNLLFEFERRSCVDIYSELVAAGLDLSRSGHIGFTGLCQCTALNPQECGRAIASVDLEIQTLPQARLKHDVFRLQ